MFIWMALLLRCIQQQLLINIPIVPSSGCQGENMSKYLCLIISGTPWQNQAKTTTYTPQNMINIGQLIGKKKNSKTIKHKTKIFLLYIISYTCDCVCAPEQKIWLQVPLFLFIQFPLHSLQHTLAHNPWEKAHVQTHSLG